MLRRSVIAGLAFAILAPWSPASADIIGPRPRPPPRPDPPGPRQLNLGPLQSILLPDLWTRSESTIAGQWAVVEFKPPGKPDISISVMFGPGGGDATSKAALYQLLVENARIAAPASLTPEQIRAISPALGNIGDNQYANDVRSPNPSAPAFDLAKAQMIEVNGKTAIKIDGSFRDRSGKPVTWFVGLAAVSKENDGNVLEAFLQAADQREFASQQDTFDTAVRSVVWRN